MDGSTLSIAKKYTSQEIEKVNQTISQVSSGIKSITPSGNQLNFTLADNSVISVTLTGLSSNDFSDLYKNKLDSLNSVLLNKFSYNGTQLLFDGQPIGNGGTIDLSNYYNKTEIDNLISNMSSKNGNINESFSVDDIIIQGDILPTTNGVQNIGSPTNRFNKIYVNEAMLSTNTLYLGETPVMGTNQDTIMIKADKDQSITMKTTGVGTTKIISENAVELSTSGMNANVTLQATGAGTNVNLGATNQINLNAPHVNIIGSTDITGNTALDSLTVRGNLTINGGTTTIESTTVQVEDNIIELNKNEVGYGVTAGKSGIKINRGDADDYLIVFDETDDSVKIGTDTSLQKVATESYVDGKDALKSDKVHNHNISDISNLQTTLDGKVSNATTVNGKALNSNITLSKSDIGLSNVQNIDTTNASNITSGILLATQLPIPTSTSIGGVKAGTNIIIESDGTISATASDSSSIDDSNISTITTYSSNKIDNSYVKKETGKSLMSDSEITRLSTVTNYDHTNVDNHMANNNIHVTATDKNNWNSKADTSSIPIKVSQLTNDSGYLTSSNISNKLESTNIKAGSNITLAVNGNDVTINSTASGGSVNNINDNLTTSTTDTYSIDKLNSTYVKQVSGKQLSTEDYTTTEKNKLASISGSNTGDETLSSIKTKLGVSSASTDGYLSSSDWNTFNNKANVSDFPTKISQIANDSGFITANNIKAGINVSLSTTGNDVTINVTGTDITSIKGIQVDDSTRANGRMLGYNGTTGKDEYMQVTVAGIVGSTGNILIPNGLPVTIPSGSEITVTHPSSNDDKLMINILEQVLGSNVTDTHVDFSDASKYVLQDSSKITISNNKLLLKKYNSNSNTLQFNGSSSYVEIPYNSLYAPTSAITIEVLAYLPNWNVSTVMSFLSKAQSGGYTLNMNAATTPGAGNIGFTAYINGAYRSAKVSLSTLTSGWHRFSGKWDGRYLRFYVDGVLVNTNDLGSTYNISYSVSNSLIVGADASSSTGVDGTTPYYFTGDIADIRFWNTAISDDIISKYAFCPLNGNESGLVGYWKVNEGTGTTLTDITGHVNATTHNTTWVADSSLIDYNGFYPTSVFLYCKTTGTSSFSLTSVNSISSVVMPLIIPTNTTIKILFSVDNGVNWLYKDGVGIHKYTSDITQSWTNYNSNTDIQTYFSNLSKSQLIADLSLLGITPISLDFIWQLCTTDSAFTPIVSPLTVTYLTETHMEYASYGRYDETMVTFGVKRIDSSTLGLKNLSSKSRTATINVITATS